ncbi:hypothetical protein [Lishizhenia sp.]|uniref:hypothetical protein n=1 Tax=Lishizhenia sp. TaxID=2497594 RepID=UPI00299CDBE5|nr:hypothetical protein [Lishizhenia sp.]MDX1446583.1 hypothetical protein [Lishizhenia sp.]
MEKSIESIWKEGFMDADALVAPRVNKLYSKKSTHIIEKFKRMFKMNLILIVIGSLVVLTASFLVGLPYMGILLFIGLNILFLLNIKFLKSLKNIDNSKSSYDYLMSFDQWLKNQISVNRRFSRLFYPYIFMALFLGFWMKNVEGKHLGKYAVEKLLQTYPDLYSIAGIPLVILLSVLCMLILLYLVGGKIYEWDFNIVYGRIKAKLDDMVNDIQALRAD